MLTRKKSRKTNKHRIHIVWAINPFSARRDSRQKATRHILDGFSARTKVTVTPVFVLNPQDLLMREEIFHSQIELLKKSAVQATVGFTPRNPSYDINPLVVLVEPNSSATESARHLATYAKKSQADLILCGTRALSPLKTILLGGFGEALVYQSQTPVLLVGNKSRGPNLESPMLFASDFSSQSFSAWKSFCRIAALLKTRTVLFRAALKRAKFSEVSVSRWLPKALVRRDEDSTRSRVTAAQHANRWLKWAETAGVRVKFKSRECVGGISQCIARAAKSEGAQIIGISSRTSDMQSVFVGSVTRSLIQLCAGSILLLPSNKR